MVLVSNDDTSLLEPSAASYIALIIHCYLLLLNVRTVLYCTVLYCTVSDK
jgi:hypothetical protein